LLVSSTPGFRGPSFPRRRESRFPPCEMLDTRKKLPSFPRKRESSLRRSQPETSVRYCDFAFGQSCPGIPRSRFGLRWRPVFLRVSIRSGDQMRNFRTLCPGSHCGGPSVRLLNGPTALERSISFISISGLAALAHCRRQD
jgi:hypothetical protein